MTQPVDQTIDRINNIGEQTGLAMLGESTLDFDDIRQAILELQPQNNPAVRAALNLEMVQRGLPHVGFTETGDIVFGRVEDAATAGNMLLADFMAEEENSQRLLADGPVSREMLVAAMISGDWPVQDNAYLMRLLNNFDSVSTSDNDLDTISQEDINIFVANVDTPMTEEETAALQRAILEGSDEVDSTADQPVDEETTPEESTEADRSDLNDPAEVHVPLREITSQYEVQAGEGFDDVALRTFERLYGEEPTIEQLIALSRAIAQVNDNDRENPTRMLHPGDLLDLPPVEHMEELFPTFVPADNEVPESSGEETYVVQAGDGFDLIARRVYQDAFDGQFPSYEELLALSGYIADLNDNDRVNPTRMLHPGAMLTVPSRQEIEERLANS